MLVLSRKPGEVIHIGDDIQVTVISVKRNYVRLGITAPKNIGVHRQELYEKTQAEEQVASRIGKNIG